MDEFISTLTYFQALSIILLFFVFIIVPISLIIFISKPYIKIGEKLTLGFNTNKKAKTGEQPHKTCEFRNDITSIFSKTVEIVTKINKITLHAKPEILMSIAEEYLYSAKFLFIGNYAKLLKTKVETIKNITSHDDYNHYELLIGTMNQNLKDIIKTYIKQNNIENMDERDFRGYIENKFEFLWNIGSSYMDDHYLGNMMMISREELKESESKIKDDIFEKFRDSFERIRSSSIQKNEEEENLWIGLSVYIENLTGIKIK